MHQLFSGKSNISQLLAAHYKELTNIDPQDKILILYCYQALPPDSHILKGNIPIKLYKGLPPINQVVLFKQQQGVDELVLILDDLLAEFTALSSETDKEYASLFVEISRKHRISCVAILQDFFPKSSALRILIKNATLVILFNFAGDKLGLQRFLNKIFASKAKLAMAALHHANSMCTTYCG